jgi:hypothetical protein
MNKNMLTLLIVGLLSISLFIFMVLKNSPNPDLTNADDYDDATKDEVKITPEEPLHNTSPIEQPKPSASQNEQKLVQDPLENGPAYESNIDGFISCLIDRGVVVYASRTCPACFAFAESLGGYAKVENLFVECNDKPERCETEMKTRYVPEIQINGELYIGSRNLESLSEVTGCKNII